VPTFHDIPEGVDAWFSLPVTRFDRASSHTYVQSVHPIAHKTTSLTLGVDEKARESPSPWIAHITITTSPRVSAETPMTTSRAVVNAGTPTRQPGAGSVTFTVRLEIAGKDFQKINMACTAGDQCASTEEKDKCVVAMANRRVVVRDGCDGFTLYGLDKDLHELQVVSKTLHTSAYVTRKLPTPSHGPSEQAATGLRAIRFANSGNLNINEEVVWTLVMALAVDALKVPWGD